jgi:metal-dependent hydrolase (beta-lactamase superfamily II)
VDRVALVITSHRHFDHFGGMRETADGNRLYQGGYISRLATSCPRRIWAEIVEFEAIRTKRL